MKNNTELLYIDMFDFSTFVISIGGSYFKQDILA